jgi:hypothetical protein
MDYKKDASALSLQSAIVAKRHQQQKKRHGRL